MANIIDDDDFFARKPIAVRSRDPWEKSMLAARTVLASAALLSIVGLIMVSAVATHARAATEFTMEVSGFAGLNATTLTLGDGTTVSPSFTLKVRVENRRVLQPWCYNGGEVLVSYSGVALAWGHAPRFCMQRRAPTEFTVLAWGREIGLSADLCRRLASDFNMGTTQVGIEMKVFHDDKGLSSSGTFNGPSLHSFQLMLRGPASD
ncbi:unnamed protein product [Urochloa humidicola]